MSTHNVTLLNIDKSQVIVNHKELRLRLMVDKDFDLSAFDKITNKAFDKAEFLCAYVTVPVTTEEDGNVNLGFTKVKSSDLAKNLDGCTNAFVFAVTLGIQAERHLVMLSKTAPSEHFITDAYYSALAEALCDKAEEIIKGEADMFLPYNIQESIKTPRRYKIGVKISPRVEGVYRASDIAYIDYISYGFLAFDFDSASDGLVCLGRGTFEGKNVIIPETSSLITMGVTDLPVRSIGFSAFGFASDIKSVVIPSSVRNIKAGAFSWSGLEYVTIREGVETLFASVFTGCTHLKDIVIPNSVKLLEIGMFAGCANLENAKIGNQIKRINANTFFGCGSLVRVSIPKSVNTIDKDAFGNCVALSHIYYEGSESEWEKISKDSGNEALANATIHYGVY
jgi:hypothetical protein